jgi:hypothetical protein
MKKKTMINRDVKFDEEWVWDWKVNDGENYDFLSVLNEENERYEDHQEPIATPL